MAYKRTGYILISIGVIMLLFVFIEAYFLFINSESLNTVGSFEGLVTIISAFINALIPAIFLGIMVWIGGLLIDKGIKVLIGS